MKLKQTFSLLVIVICFFQQIHLHAQVTIGLGEEPSLGSLLDLKNIKGVTDGSADATKGLVLPRVKLSALTDIANGDITGVTSTNAAEHVGLVVYNTNTIDNSNTNRVCPGVHVWDGSKWMPLKPYPDYPDLLEILHEKYPPKTYTDIRGGETEVYNIAWFGVFNYGGVEGVSDISDYSQYSCDPNQEVPEIGKGEYWFTQNLRTKQMPNGTPIPLTTVSTTKGRSLYGYPHPTHINNSYYYDQNKHYGLLYTWQAIVGNDNPIDPATPNQSFPVANGEETTYIKDKDGNDVLITASGSMNIYNIPYQNYEVEVLYESASGKKDGKVQGICPNGWHVPSQREWYELLYRMTIGGQLFADVYSGVGLQPEERKNTAWIMAASEEIKGGNSIEPLNPKFMSRASNDNGYHALLSGWGYSADLNTRGYAANTWIWSSSSTDDRTIGVPSARDFYFANTFTQLQQFNDQKEYLLPIRCVENKH